ncbi:MAG TPA: endo-1,4-beta-xylanase [Terriglobia bacterium]|nr:endo-1,4-beta-xylanase [Terriglobia bacterium]
MNWQVSVQSRKNVPVILLCVPLLAAAWTRESARPADKNTLRQYADKIGFQVGAPIPGRIWNEDPQYRAILAKEFNAAVSFTFMNLTQPEEGQFNFSGMDRDMAFAQEHHLKLFGDCLLYRCNTSPGWVCSPARRALGRTFGWSADRLDAVMKTQIQTVVRHGGDSYYAWEVADEPLSHNNPWEVVLGREEYLTRAFHYAHEANPHALLVLNETLGHQGVDKDRAAEFLQLVKKLKSAGAPIDAIGVEMHLEAPLRPGWLDEFRSFLAGARQAGVQVLITEMDVYQGPAGAFSDPWANQKEIYAAALGACLADSGCKGFYTWGISDAHTWLAQRQNHRLPDARPLLFDERYGRKPAYFGVLDALKDQATHH